MLPLSFSKIREKFNMELNGGKHAVVSKGFLHCIFTFFSVYGNINNKNCSKIPKKNAIILGSHSTIETPIIYVLFAVNKKKNLRHYEQG